MKTIAEYTDLNIPTWALCYLVNGDASGLSQREIDQIDTWAKSFSPSDPKQHFLLSTESEEYFASNPEFGLPATCVQGTVVIAVDESEVCENCPDTGLFGDY